MSNNVYAFTVQTADLGQVQSPESGANDATARNPLGVMMKWGDNMYRYVQSSTGVGVVATATAGVAHWKTLTLNAATPVWLATSDASDGVGGGVNDAAGIYKGVITTLYYTWLAVAGAHLVQVAANMVTSDMLIATAAADLVAARVAAAANVTGVVIGVAQETRGATVANQSLSLLTGLIW